MSGTYNKGNNGGNNGLGKDLFGAWARGAGTAGSFKPTGGGSSIQAQGGSFQAKGSVQSQVPAMWGAFWGANGLAAGGTATDGGTADPPRARVATSCRPSSLTELFKGQQQHNNEVFVPLNQARSTWLSRRH